MLLHTQAFAAATVQLLCWWDIRSQEAGEPRGEGRGMANRLNTLLVLDLRTLFVFSVSAEKMGNQEWCYNLLWIINDSLKNQKSKILAEIRFVLIYFSFLVFVLFFYTFKFRCLLVQTEITPSLCCPS